MERYTGPRRRPTRPKITTESPCASQRICRRAAGKDVPAARRLPFQQRAGFAPLRGKQMPARALARLVGVGAPETARYAAACTRICVPGCGVQRGAFARPNRRGQTARTCPGPAKGPGRRLWNARQNSFSAICEFHNNKSGKHFSNTFIFGIMYAVKIGLSTRFGAFQRARPRPCESTLRGGGRPGCVLRVQPQPD